MDAVDGTGAMEAVDLDGALHDELLKRLAVLNCMQQGGGGGGGGGHNVGGAVTGCMPGRDMVTRQPTRQGVARCCDRMAPPQDTTSGTSNVWLKWASPMSRLKNRQSTRPCQAIEQVGGASTRTRRHLRTSTFTRHSLASRKKKLQPCNQTSRMILTFGKRESHWEQKTEVLGF